MEITTSNIFAEIQRRVATSDWRPIIQPDLNILLFDIKNVNRFEAFCPATHPELISIRRFVHNFNYMHFLLLTAGIILTREIKKKKKTLAVLY